MAGHVDYLSKAKEFGDVLVVAVNSDESIRRIKGEKRPITPLSERGLYLQI
jgi:cytidyltransferase-like protein